MSNDNYAFLDRSNVVIEVITGPQQAGSGINWEEFYGKQRGLVCKRTTIDGSYRKNYAGIGYTYDATRDAFIPPIPGPAAYWALVEQTCQWTQTLAGAKFYISQAVNQHIDATVAQRDYNNIDSMPKYLPSTNARYAAEAAAAVAWCTAVWEKVEEIQNEVLSGQRPIPSVTEVINELPVIQWPA